MNMAVSKKNVFAYKVNAIIRSAKYERFTRATIKATGMIVVLQTCIFIIKF